MDTLEQQIKRLYRVIYFLIVFLAITSFLSIIALTNATDDKTSYLRETVAQQQVEIDNLKENQKRLFNNEQVLVTNQQKLQNGQRVSSFASFLAKMLL